ncbi:MAG: hydrogenase 3 maturation endopeptidase HyCI [Nitrososphaerales archaeon]|nr:hydrogenase 3 maturation endopeptidase HyCI [Nitrososphaerales archaeon]
MKTLAEELRAFKRLVVLGIGNELRGDDIVGVLVAERLKKVLKDVRDVLVINCGTTPENFLSKVKTFDPSHVLVIDAVDFKGEPGSIVLFRAEDNVIDSISTHRLPISLIKAYFEGLGLNIKFFVMGVQPMSILLGTKIAPRVEEAVIMATKMLEKVVKGSAHQ